MKFRNRQEAGRQVAARLGKYGNREDVLVLGLPRGGVPVAYEVATALEVPLDIFVLRKLGVPGHEELAFGAIGSGGVRILNADVVDRLGISELEVAAVTQEETKELERRETRYRGSRPPLDVRGRTVILVDDGIATGASIRAAIHAIRKMRPAAIVVATPVAPRATCNLLRREVDELVCAESPEPFYGVGQFYQDFSAVSDEEVVALLDPAVLEKRRSKEAAAPVLAET
jgi:putative phosphoribosyl transferase